MQILRLKVNNFGKIKNKEIEFKDGINIVYGKNESGKSTLLKFIMGMFYGLSKNKNGKFISDMERYTPWEGGEFSGKIEYKLDNGEKYEVFREFKKKNPIIYNENLEDISNTFNIDKVTGNKFFYDQTKVDEELFTSSIVAMQDEVKLEEKEQKTLVQKMSNMISTGEDNLSFQKIINKLNKRQMEEIGTARTQDRPINIVERRLEEIHEQKEYLSNFANKKYEIGEQRENLELQIKQDEEKLKLLKELENVQQKISLKKEKAKINENAIKEYNEKIESLKSNLKDNKEDTSIKQEKNSKIKALEIGMIIIFLLSIVSILIIKNDIITAILIAIFVVLSISVGYMQYKSKIKNNTNIDLQNKKNISIQDEIDVLSKSSSNLEEEIKNAKKEIEEEYNEEKEVLKNKYIGLIPVKEINEILQKETVVYDINMLQNRITTNKVNIHTNNVDLNNILPQVENLAALEEENARLENRYKELIKKNELINLAKSEIEKAYKIMKENITPQFTNNLSEIIQKISQGKYKNIRLDEENGIIVEVENGNYMNAKNLSIGTIDQLYLSLRLGAGKTISEETLPIVLDETFAYWDEERLKNILKYINEEFKKSQIILFTCTDREKNAIEELGYGYNYLEIN